METGDRISELYKGEIFSAETQSIGKQRINWMCQQVEGQKVIDIGCSQGIASILLAREGFEVVGVDISSNAIEYANSERAKEPPEVQQRLTFVRGNIYDVDLPAREFHTTIMGEFLEHQVRPDKAVTRAHELLVDAGKLIITVPFGLLEDPDHKQTFYVASLYKLIYPYFVISKVEIIGRYLCLLCKKREVVLGKQVDSIELALVEGAEQEFQRREEQAAKFQAELYSTRSELRSTRSELRSTRADLKATMRVTTRLRLELVKEKRRVQAVRDSFSFRLGHALVRPIRRPGRIAVLVLYRLLTMSPDGLRRVILKVVNKSKMLTSLKSFAETATLSAVKQKQLRAVLPMSKTAALSTEKAHILETVKERINKIKQEMEGITKYTAELRMKDLKVAVIMDRFTYECFKYEAELITFTPENWKEVLSEQRPDLLLVESAWHGNVSTWQGKVGKYSDEAFATIVELVDYCRHANIPAIFFNKEDPVHFNRFKDTAALFDHVFTTDANCIPRYMDLKSPYIKTVKAVPFAAQPAIHNPIRACPRENNICYAGTYYAGRVHFDERCAQLDILLEAAATHGLVIYDRNSENMETSYRFPERFSKCIYGALDYSEMVIAYKMHRIFLNVNSVPDSPTMCSRRVFENIASGAAVVSGPGKAVELIFGDTVPIVKTLDSAREVIDKLMTDEDYFRNCVSTASRIIWRSHTYGHRLAEMANVAGLNIKMPAPVSYSALSVDVDDQGIKRLLDILVSQTHPPTEIWFGVREKSKLADYLEACKNDSYRDIPYHVVHVGDVNVEESYRILASKAASDWVAIVSSQHEYGEHCFEDLANSLLYANADVVGKGSYYYRDTGGNIRLNNQDLEHCFQQIVFPHVALARRTTVATHGWNDLFDQTSDWQQSLMKEDTHFYSADRDSFTAVEPLRCVTSKKRILVAGHDLKFINPLCRKFSDYGYDIAVDKWEGHDIHNVDESLALVKEADIIICEWCLGNAVWYSKNKRPGQKLIVRFHLQERHTKFPDKVVMKEVDKVIFVASHVRCEAISRFGWEKWAEKKLTIIPTSVETEAFDLTKSADAQFNIGIVGIVPQRKRLDLALDIAEKLRQEDERFHLHVKGKMPHELSWMLGRAEELQYYQDQMDRIKNSDLLKDAVHFDGWGDDMSRWYQKTGFILSTSDFEGAPATVVEAAASKAVPILLRWEGSDEIYPEDWSYDTVDEAARAISDIVQSSRFEEIAAYRYAFVKQNFDIERIARLWLEVIEPGHSSIDSGQGRKKLK